jgi:hypothetical protein
LVDPYAPNSSDALGIYSLDDLTKIFIFVNLSPNIEHVGEEKHSYNRWV